MRSIAVFLLLLQAARGQEQPEKPREESSAPSETTPTETAEPAARTQLNLLGQTDAKSGESRRNENIQFNLIDNNALKELNSRLGVTATANTVFDASRNYFGAEYGQAPTTGIPLASAFRSAWHGNLFWSHQNSAVSARAFFQVGGVKPARDNDFGFSAGGPLWRGSTFLVEGNQKILRGQVNGNVLVPLATERTPLPEVTDPATRAFVQRILNAYPAEVPNRTDIDQRMLNTNSPQAIDNRSLSGRLDQRVSAKDQLVMRHAFLTQQVKAFQLVKGQNPDTTTMSHRSNLTWNKTVSANTLAFGSMGFERVHTLIVPERNNLGPQIFISGVLTAIFPHNAVPIDRVQNLFRYAGGARSLKGKHSLTAGFELMRRQFNGYEGDSQLGAFTFSNNFGRTAIETLRLGRPTYYYISTSLVPQQRGFRNWDNFFHAGDTWQARPNLTVNASVNYRPISRPHEVNGYNTLAYSSDNNNVGGALGIAYRTGKLGVWRMGYGMHYGEIFPVTFQAVRFNAPNNIKLVIGDPDLVNPLSRAPADLSQAGRTVLYAFTPDLVSPYAHQFSAVWEIPLRRNWKVETGYVGSRALKLLQRWHINRALQVPGMAITTGNIDDRRTDPNYGDIRYTTGGSRAYYDAWRTALTIPRWKDLSLEAAYWFSKNLDLGSSYTNTAYDTDAFNNRAQTEFRTHEDLKGRSDFDQPNSFLVRGSYTLPWRGRRLGTWSVNSVYLAKSGTPFNLRTGSDAPGFGNVDGVSGERPNHLDPSVWGYAVGDPDTSRALLPKSAFGFLALGQQAGSLGRNVFRRGSIRNWNASVSSDWALMGDMRLTMRAESINLSNTPQFAEPGTSLTDPNFGAITNTLNDGRTFRLHLRLTF
jgi:hypothetical protein